MIGLITFFIPGVTALTLGYLVGIWAIVTGILEVVAAFRLRRDVPGEIFLFIAGVLSFIVGIWLVAFPLAALLALVYLLAIYAIFGGIALSVLALRLKTHRAPAAT